MADKDEKYPIKKDSVLKKLIKVFRTSNVIKHHFQSTSTGSPIGTAKAFFKNTYSFQSSVIPGSAHYDRFARYSDYAEQESFSILANSLNIVADETTQKNEHGKIIEVVSEKDAIKEVLQDLFDNILKLNGKYIWKLVRNLCKYGDAFYLIDVTEQNGVVGLIMMPANEVEKEEGFDKEEPGAIRFRWTSKNNIELPNAYVAHFKLEGNDMFHPYGMCLKFDTKILTKDGIKDIKDIKPGDYVLSFDTKTQRQQFSKVLNTINSGEKECFSINTRHNFIEASKEHKILICKDGEFKYEFVSNVKVGDKLVISKNHKTENKIKINKEPPENNKNGYWNSNNNIPEFVNRDFAKLFGFLLGDGWIQNENTVYFALGVYDEINKYYQGLLEQFSGKTSRLIKRHNSDNFASTCVGSKMLVTILRRMGFEGNVYEKRLPQWVFSADTEIKEAVLQGFFEADGSEFTDKWGCTRYQIELANEALAKDLKCLIQSLGYKSSNIKNRRKGEQKIIEGYDTTSAGSYYFYYYKSTLKQSQRQDIDFRKTQEYIVEPILSIEKSGVSEVYDIHVDNENHNFYANGIVVHNSILEPARRPWRQILLLEDAMLVYRITRAPERRVFKLDMSGIPPEDRESTINKFNQELRKNKIVSDDGKLDLRYASTLTMESDFVIPVVGKESGTTIETLPGAQNLGDIEDIQYIEQKLFAAIGIPKAYLTYEDSVSKQVLTQEDIRFARTIARIQEAVINELVKIAMIHLYVKGVRGEDLLNFKIKMTNPSTVSELQKNELWRARMELVQSAGEGVFDTTFIYKNFLNLSDETIDAIRKGQIQDKIFQSKLVSIENSQGMAAGAMAGGGLGGGLGGLGGGMGGSPFGGPSLGGGMGGIPGQDLGGGTPNVGGMPPVPGPAESIDRGVRKNIHRDPSGDSRKAKSRFVDGLGLTPDIEQWDEDPNDTQSITRTYSSPFGESLSSFKEICQKYKVNILEEAVYKAYPFLRPVEIGPDQISGLNEEILVEQFGPSVGVKETVSVLKENVNLLEDWENKLQELNSVESVLKEIDTSPNKILRESNKKNK